MPVPDLESYIKTSVEGRLNNLLGNPYIISENILMDFPTSVRKSFIDTYCYDASKKESPKAEIPVSFTYTELKDNMAQVLIQYKGGTELVDTENGNSLGLINGNSNNAYNGVELERKVALTGENITLDDGTQQKFLVATLDHTIGEIDSIQGVETTQYQIKDNKILFPYNDFLEGMTTSITYMPIATTSAGQDIQSKSGLDYGYNVMENFIVDTISTNIDTLRCLNAILKVILITMKLDVKEQTEYRLNTLQFAGVDILEAIGDANSTAFGNQVYYRRTEISYQVTYSMNVALTNVIKQIKTDIEME